MTNTTDTICAIATAPGGALGIIRISGPEAIPITQSICTTSLSRHDANTIRHSLVRSTDGEIIDEVMVCTFRAPHSFTGEDSCEISCHGSLYILKKIVELLVAGGARTARPGEYTQRAFLNGKLDLSQAEAVADLIASTNRATHRMAVSQLRGHFSSELSRLREQLLKLTTLLELELDFSDHEEIEFANRSELLVLARHTSTHIHRLAKSFETGQAMKQGIPVAIIGAPNVGKSTLLNALVGEERAIVSDIEGTTRDTVEDTITIDGIPFRFIDTAGIRHTDNQIERLGIERSMRAARQARIIILMTEPGVPFPDIVTNPEQSIIRITNKTAEFQALNGIGLDALRQQISSLSPHIDTADVIVSSARHYECLLQANESLLCFINGLQENLPSDLLAEHLRLTLAHLAEITGGAITPQETLNNIFHHFCIGK